MKKTAFFTILSIIFLLLLSFSINQSFSGTNVQPASASSEKVTILTLEKDALRIKNDKVLFEPGRNIRRASYVTYVFDKQEFLKKIGKIENITKVKVKVAIIKEQLNIENPSNPYSQRPVGGFRITYFICQIKELVR